MIQENSFISYTPIGWKCPICNNVYAPAQPYCLFCNIGSKVKNPVTPSTTSRNPNEIYGPITK